MKKVFFRATLSMVACLLLVALPANSQVKLLARGTLTASRAGSYRDLSGLNYELENGVPANLLGGLGSGMTYAGGDTFLAIPDRGPNAVSYNSLVDDTVSYITRFHTIEMKLTPNRGAGLPFQVTPQLRSTTLLNSFFPLTYGSGDGLGLGSGKPARNNFFQHFFTGRSDNFDADQNSGFVNDARLDPESIRVSNDGLTVFVSDEYGPYIYQFLRFSGTRIRTFKAPDEFFVATPAPTGDGETAANSSGRVPNKGMIRIPAQKIVHLAIVVGQHHHRDVEPHSLDFARKLARIDIADRKIGENQVEALLRS